MGDVDDGEAHDHGQPDCEEKDELDLFMEQINAEISKGSGDNERDKPSKGVREDIEKMDDQETYFKYMDETAPAEYAMDDQCEYDSDGNVVTTYVKREIVPLPPVNHSEICYPPFQNNFLNEHSDISSLSDEQVDKMRKDLGVRVSGLNPARPCTSFAYNGFDQNLMETIRRHDYSTPTSIQAQAIPVALSGRDIIGIAQTGSGKTAAYLLPMMIHVIAQPELQEGDGPIAVVCAPTRELCQQIYGEAKRFARAYNLTVTAAFGGVNKHEQSLALQKGAEIVVCTPGRLIDHVKDKSTNLRRVTLLVFDEADRMFDLGFEAQVRSIANNVRPDRQTLLFSATFKKKIEKLCREVLTDPVRIVVGELGEANEDVCQSVVVFPSTSDKWAWLLMNIVKFSSTGNVLVFVTKKENCVEVGKKLKENGHEVGVIHGDFDQYERDSVLSRFRKGTTKVLVATDVAARGLDIPSIRTVVNYDVARDITTHTHRVGRTGRAGQAGEAWTLVTPEDLNFLPDLVRNLEGANQQVPYQVMELALKNPWFKKQREKHGFKAKGSAASFKPRLGLGFKNAKDGAEQPSSRGTTVDSAVMQANVLKKTGSDKLAMIRSAFAKDYGRFKKSESSSMSGTVVTSQLPVMHATKRTASEGDGVPKLQVNPKRKSRWDA